MIEAAIRKIETMANEANKTNQYEIKGRTYTDKPMLSLKDPLPASLEVNTLDGLAGYLQANLDALDTKSLMVCVDSESRVLVRGPLSGDFLQRPVYIEASLVRDQFTFDRYMDVETFIILMQARFVPTDDSTGLLAIIGNIEASEKIETKDDGVTQVVSAKSGLMARVEDKAIKNPLSLRPFRTFSEVDQPASQFTFRMRKGANGPECALFEADGGAWKLEAMASIKSYLESKLPGMIVLA